MSDIFISYASEDRPQVERIVDALTACGWNLWWDRSIPPGKTYDEVIEQAITAAKCIVVVWSGHSVASRWVRSEAEEGVEREVLVPVLIEDVRIPLAFRRIQAAQLIDWQGSISDVGFTRLVEALSSLLGPPPSPPAKLPLSPSSGKPRDQQPKKRSSTKRGFEEMEDEAWVEKAKKAEANGDYSGAMNIIRPLAHQGNAVAQYALGQAFFHGYGVRRDLLEATRWYREAAVQGYAKAQFSLALMYGRYLGMPEDLDDAEARVEEARDWARKAAAQGHVEAKELTAKLAKHHR